MKTKLMVVALLTLVFSNVSFAQSEKQSTRITSSMEMEEAPELRPLNMDSIQLQPRSENANRLFNPEVPAGLSIVQTPEGYRPVSVPSYYGFYPFGSWTSGIWDLHQGLNVSLETGVSVGFGKNNPCSGAAFYTNIAAVYAHPVNDRLTLALGMNYGQFTGWGTAQNRVGIFGMANYRFNDRVDATGFISHEFGIGRNNVFGRSPYLPCMSGSSTTVGADVGIKVGENSKINIGLSFEKREDPVGPPVFNPQRNAQQR